MAVALFDIRCAVNFRHFGALRQDRIIGAQSHCPTFVVADLAFDFVVALYPFLEVVDHWCETFLTGLVVELFRARIAKVCQITCSLNHRHLHS